MRRSLIVLLLAGATAAAVARTADLDRAHDATQTADFFRQVDQNEKVIHALDRLTWGITPGQVQQVEKMGLKKWIDLQLHPDRIPENPELQEKLAALSTIRMSAGDMLDHYPTIPLVRAMAAGRRPLPTDPQTRDIVAREVAQLLHRQQKKGAAAKAAMQPLPDANTPAANTANFQLDQLEQLARQLPADARRQPLRNLLPRDELISLRRGGPLQRVRALEALSPADRDLVLRNLPRKAAFQVMPWLPEDQAREVELNSAPQMVVATDLQQAKVLRAVYTNRQLEDVLTDFWFNHFNVFINKGADHYLVTEYERDAIRPHVLGKFQDLLLATAKSPAMLFFLDNWRSVDPNAAARLAHERQQRRQRRIAMMRARGVMFGRPRFGRFPGGFPARRGPRPVPKKTKNEAGINENYGRELMELHTLGVNGGYTQQDVIEVARCFTGWTIRDLNGHPGFFYNDRLHDKGAKVVLGHKIPAGGGMSDGLKVIQILAHSPATAHHISYELAQRFVADNPPPALVDRMAATFLHTDGDLRKVMETMINSKEFWQTGYDRNKVKSPLEMVVSSLRATGADIQNPLQLTRVIAQMGEPLYGMQPPTGYANTGDTWVSSSGLIARMNFALALAGNRFPGVTVNLSRFVPGDDNIDQVASRMFHSLLRGDVSPATRATIDRMLAQQAGRPGPSRLQTVSDDNPHPATPAETQLVAGLILGSPEFQKH